MEIDVAADDDGAPNRFFDAGGDLVPILVPVDEAWGRKRRAHQNNEREGSPYEDSGHYGSFRDPTKAGNLASE